MNSIAAIGISVACLLTFSAFGADEASPVAKPEVKLGDRWAYRRTNFLNNAVMFTEDYSVASTGPDEILVVARRRGSGAESDQYFTSEWNAIALGGLTLIPRTGFFQFPLKAGASYETTYETSNKNSPARSKYELKVKVTGWEDISVPAGKFRALKLEANGTFIRLDQQRLAGIVRIGFWYVPEIRRWVKYTYEDATRGFNYPDTTFGEELLNFRVQ